MSLPHLTVGLLKAILKHSKNDERVGVATCQMCGGEWLRIGKNQTECPVCHIPLAVRYFHAHRPSASIVSRG
jgi:rubrerythrin